MIGVEIEIGGKSRKLRYDFNAIADAEEKAGLGISNMFSDDRAGLNSVRLLVWAGLKWRERGLTIERTGDMLQDFVREGGSLEAIMDKVRLALERSGLLKFQEVDDGEEGNLTAETD